VLFARLTPIRPDLSMGPLVSVKMLLLMAHPRTKATLFLHLQTPPETFGTEAGGGWFALVSLNAAGVSG